MVTAAASVTAEPLPWPFRPVCSGIAKYKKTHTLARVLWLRRDLL